MILYETHVGSDGTEYRIYLDSVRTSGDRFYCRMGRFFADRDIARELEEPIFDSAESNWLLAYDGDAIVAFGCLDASRLEKHGEVLLTYGYVLPDYRQRGLHTALFHARLKLAEAFGASAIRGVANGNSRKTFEAHGFSVVRQAGRFTYFRKELHHAE